MTQAKFESAWTLVLASIGAFMTALDTLVVASALSGIAAAVLVPSLKPQPQP